MKKIKKVLPFIIPPLVVLFILGLNYYKNQLYPFGDRTVAWCDMTQQVIPLLTDFKDILTGKAGVFLNFQNAGGMNLWGVIFFFIASPFTLLVAFVKKVDMVYFVNILLALKLMTCALTSMIYFKTCQKKLHPAFAMILSICYAFCGYGMMFYQNIIWLDMMYIFPLLVVAFNYMFEKKKMLPYVITMIAFMVVNYYIGYMIVLYVLLFMGLACFRYRKEEKYSHVATQFIIGSFVAALASAVVWLPSFIQYLSSGRTTSIIDNLQGSDLFASYQTTSGILLSTASVLTVVAICTLDAKKRNKKLNTYLIMLFLMIIPLFIEPVNKMWHTGNYMSFPARYGFITMFVAIICAGYYLSDDENRKIKEKKHCDNFITFVVLAGILYCAYVFAITFVVNNEDTISTYAKTLWGSESSFLLILELFVIMAVIYTVVLIVYKRGLVSKESFALFLALLVCIESYANLDVYVSANSMANPDRATNQQEAIDLADRIDDDDFYRVKTSSKMFDVNLIGSMGYNSISHYTSLTSRDYMYMMKGLGYSSYWMEVGSNGGTELTDALLSIKYNIQKDSDSDTDDNSVYSNGTYKIVPTDTYMPLGLAIKNDLTQYESLTQYSREDIQEILYDNLLSDGNDDIVTHYEYSSLDDVAVFGDNKPYNIRLNGTSGSINYKINVLGTQSLYFDCFDKYSADLTEEINKSFSISVNGVPISTNYPSQSENGLLSLGTFTNEKVEVTVRPLNSVVCNSFGVFGINLEKLDSSISNAKKMNLTEDAGKVTGTYTAESGEKCFVTIPYQDNLTVKVNGEKVSYSKVLGDFITFDLQEGENEISITATPKGFTAGLVISIFGVALIAAYLIFRKKFESKILENTVITTACKVVIIGVGAIMLLVIYIAPCVINIMYDLNGEFL